MIVAPVGFQCPDCVANAEESTRGPLSPMGTAVIRDAYVTKVLIGICGLVFVAEYLIGLDVVVREWGMSPGAVSLHGEWWRLMTAAFLHGGLLHILFNMYVLWVIGAALESLFGHVRYAILYLVSALGGSVASYAFGPFGLLSVGASGAIFGLMAALIVAGHHLRRDVTQVVFLLAINVVIGFLAPGIDWRAHLGGAVTGAVVAAVMAYAPRQSRKLWQTLGVLAWLGILVTVLTLRTGQIEQQFLPVDSGRSPLRSLAPSGPGSSVTSDSDEAAPSVRHPSTGSPHEGITTQL